MTILEACPFCGHSATLQYDDERRWRQVVCGGCGAKSSEHPSEDAPAIAAWNRRATRSVPEAGKAVVWLPDPIGVNEIWQTVYDSLDLSEDLRTECANEVSRAIAKTFSSPASIPAPSGAEPVAKKRYCQCNSLTNPCIVCGLPKFIDPTWLKRKIEEDPDEGEIGAGFELLPAPQAPAEGKFIAEWRTNAEIEAGVQLDASAAANETGLTERLRGPAFGTPTALQAADAIDKLQADVETWKTRAERLADMHRDMCVVAGETEARATTSEAEATSLRRKLEEAERERDEWADAKRKLEARQYEQPWSVNEATQWQMRAETAERKLEEHRKALEIARGSIVSGFDTAAAIAAIDRALSGASE